MARSWMRVALVVAVVAVAATFPIGGAVAHDDTLLTDQFTLPLSITPGLCAPGDTAECVGPDEATWAGASTFCIVEGLFEGRVVPPGSPCHVELSGVMVATPPFTKPNCASLSGRGEGTFTINGETRTAAIEFTTVGTVVRTIAYFDDADADTDPWGDHKSDVPGFTIRSGNPPGTIACVTGPLTAATAGGATVFQ